MTAADVRELVQLHASLIRPRGWSALQFAANVGGLVTVAAVGWALTGTPGAPAVTAAIRTYLVPFLPVLAVLFGTSLALWYWADSSNVPSVYAARAHLKLPWEFLWRLRETAFVLIGMSTVALATTTLAAYAARAKGIAP